MGVTPRMFHRKLMPFQQVDEADLGLDLELPDYNPKYMTDYSYTLVHLCVARYQVKAARLHRQDSHVSYETVLELAQGLQQELAAVQAKLMPETSTTLQPYHKDLLVAVLANRLLRLHRPFFMKGYSAGSQRANQYGASVRACLENASLVCRALAQIGTSGFTSTLWYVTLDGHPKAAR